MSRRKNVISAAIALLLVANVVVYVKVHQRMTPTVIEVEMSERGQALISENAEQLDADEQEAEKAARFDRMNADVDAIEKSIQTIGISMELCFAELELAKAELAVCQDQQKKENDDG